MLAHRLAHEEVAEPLAVRRHHVPRRVLGGGVGEHVLERVHVERPLGALVDVVDGELPVLGGVFQARVQARQLLVAADGEEELEDHGALLHQHLLEVVDLPVAALDLLGLQEAVHAADDHVLVVAAVEDAHLALGGAARVDAPEVVVRELHVAGLLEGMHRDALRVEAGHHLADHAVLARGVDALQHDQHAAAAVGPELHLQLVHARHVLVEARLAVGLREATVVVGLPVLQRDVLPGLDDEVLQVGLGHGAELTPSSGCPPSRRGRASGRRAAIR